MSIKPKFLVVLMLLFVLGCAPKVTILLDGVPLPGHSYRMKSPATGLDIEVVAANYINADEEGEAILWPIYFKVDKMYTVNPDNTNCVKIMVKIRNPNKVWYELREYSSTESLIERGKASTSTRGIYSGRLRFKYFDLTHAVENNTKQNHSVEVRNAEGLSLIRIGTFSYKVQRLDFSNEKGGG